jgi:hypothetical protein
VSGQQPAREPLFKCVMGVACRSLRHLNLEDQDIAQHQVAKNRRVRESVPQRINRHAIRLAASLAHGFSK